MRFKIMCAFCFLTRSAFDRSPPQADLVPEDEDGEYDDEPDSPGAMYSSDEAADDDSGDGTGRTFQYTFVVPEGVHEGDMVEVDIALQDEQSLQVQVQIPPGYGRVPSPPPRPHSTAHARARTNTAA